MKALEELVRAASRASWTERERKLAGRTQHCTLFQPPLLLALTRAILLQRETEKYFVFFRVTLLMLPSLWNTLFFSDASQTLFQPSRHGIDLKN